MGIRAEISNLAMRMPSFAAAMGITSSQMSETIQNAIGLSFALGMDVMTAVKRRLARKK